MESNNSIIKSAQTETSVHNQDIELVEYKAVDPKQDIKKLIPKNNDEPTIITIESNQCLTKCKICCKQCCKNKCEKILNIWMAIFEIAGIVCYSITLKGCTNTQTQCLIKFSGNIIYLLVFLVGVSSLSYLTCAILVYHKLLKWYHLAAISIIYFILSFVNFGVNLDKHGAFNLLGLVIIGVLLFILYLILYFFYWLLKKKKYIIFSVIIFVLLVIYIYLYFTQWKNSCIAFYNGLGGKKLINNQETDVCGIPKPDLCLLPKFDGVIDYSKIIFLDCKKHTKNEKKIFMKYLDGKLANTTRFAFPSTVGYDLKQQSNLFQFNRDILDAVVDIDTEIPKKHHEVILEFDEKKHGHITIALKKNETLIKERAELRKQLNKTMLYKNILFIYTDAFSRQHFIRKFKEISKYIENYLYDSTNENIKDKVSFQFLRYHSFSHWTHINVAPMFYGATMLDGNGTNLVKYFKERGYITGMTEDFCSKELYDIEQNDFNAHRNWEDWDHENVAMFCDANYHDRYFPFPTWKGAYANLRRCLYGRDAYEYSLEYAEQFWEEYANEPKFFRLGFIDGHEGSLEVIKYLDEPLLNMIKKLDNKGFLEDTAIVFASDHGDNMFGFIRFVSPDFHVEKYLGTFFLILPNSKDPKMIENFKKLEYNAQRYISPFDIHDTLLYMLYYYDEDRKDSYSETGQTVFEEIDGMTRNCEKYKDFSIGVCICKKLDN